MSYKGYEGSGSECDVTMKDHTAELMPLLADENERDKILVGGTSLLQLRCNSENNVIW